MHACTDIPVIGTHVIISESERDLRVLSDRELSLVAHVTADVYLAGYNQPCHPRPVIRSLSVHATETIVQSPRLLQLIAVRHQ